MMVRRPLAPPRSDRFNSGREKPGASGAKDHELARGTDSRPPFVLAAAAAIPHMASVSTVSSCGEGSLLSNVVPDEVVHIGVAVVINAVGRDLVRV